MSEREEKAVFRKLEAALSDTGAWCPRCEDSVGTYKRIWTDYHPGLYYKTKTTYCVQCDADLNHETIDSGRT